MKIHTEDPRYNRDLFSKAILAKDKKSLELHRLRNKQMNEIKSESKEINNLKEEVNEIKIMLNKILLHLNKNSEEINGDN